MLLDDDDGLLLDELDEELDGLLLDEDEDEDELGEDEDEDDELGTPQGVVVMSNSATGAVDGAAQRQSPVVWQALVGLRTQTSGESGSRHARYSTCPTCWPAPRIESMRPWLYEHGPHAHVLAV